jgi:hypothetical protein
LAAAAGAGFARFHASQGGSAAPPGGVGRAGHRLDLFAAQRFDQLRQEAGEFAGHQREIGVELLVGVFGVLLGLFLEQVEEGEALDFQLFAEHEGNAVVPGQRQAGRQLAGREVGLDLAATSSPSGWRT